MTHAEVDAKGNRFLVDAEILAVPTAENGKVCGPSPKNSQLHLLICSSGTPRKKGSLGNKKEKRGKGQDTML